MTSDVRQNVDLEKLTASKAAAVRIDDEKIFDLPPLTDAHGGDLKGVFVVLEVPSRKLLLKPALKIGMVVRDELQAKIPSRAALYQP